MGEYKRYDSETDEELIYRICSEKEKIGSWQEVADILNKLLNTEYTESKFRKQRQAFDKMLSANQSKFADSYAQLKEIEIQKRELERKKIQFRDERNAWQKQNFTDDNRISIIQMIRRKRDGSQQKNQNRPCTGNNRTF